MVLAKQEGLFEGVTSQQIAIQSAHAVHKNVGRPLNSPKKRLSIKPKQERGTLLNTKFSVSEADLSRNEGEHGEDASRREPFREALQLCWI